MTAVREKMIEATGSGGTRRIGPVPANSRSAPAPVRLQAVNPNPSSAYPAPRAHA